MEQMSEPSSTCEAENRFFVGFPLAMPLVPFAWWRRRDSQNRNRREENEETNSHVRNIIVNKQFCAKGFQFHTNLSIIDRLLLVLLAASAVQAGPRPQLRADLAYGRLSCKKKLMKKCKMSYIFRCRKRQRLLWYELWWYWRKSSWPFGPGFW